MTMLSELPFNSSYSKIRATLIMFANDTGLVVFSIWGVSVSCILTLPESFELLLDLGRFTGGRSMLLLLQLARGSLRKWLMNLLA